jgi:hypothetical protein
MTLPTQRLLTTAELSDYLQRSKQWVRENATSLAGMKVGSLWRFDLDEVRAAIKATRNEDLSEKRPDGLDILTPTPLSAKRQAAKNSAA